MAQRAAAPGHAADDPPGTSALGCLVAVARMSGVNLSVDRLARGLGPGEPTLAALAACAESAGFRCRPVSVGPDALDALGRALPAIVRLRDGTSRVLTRVTTRDDLPTVTLLDPDEPEPGPRELSAAAFAQTWSGDVLLLKRSVLAPAAEQPFGWAAVRALALGERRLLRDLILASVALSALALAPILFVQALLGDALVGADSRTYLFLCLGFAVLVLFEAGFTAVRRGLLARLATRVGLQVDTLVFARVLHLPMAVLERMPAGVVAHALRQARTIRLALAGPVATLTLDAAVAVVMVGAMLATSVALTVVFLAVAALTALVVVLNRPRHRRAVASLAAVEATAATFLAETLGGFGVVKSLALEGRQRQRWDVLTARATKLRLAVAATGTRLDVIGTLAHRGLVVLPFGVGVALATLTASTVSRPALIAMVLFAWRAAQPLRDLAAISRAVTEADVAVGAIAAVISAPEETDARKAGARPLVRGQISFAGVTFSYPDAATPALQAVSFDVPAGTTLGIMGRSGAGKSTVARLLQRMHTNFEGLIKLDGVDLREFDLDHLRRAVTVVGQESRLFPGTVRDILLAARPDASQEALDQTLRLVGAEQLVEALPHGLDTMLQEDASPLSEGERQRLAIARAILADPKVLVLDEATSALDPESEALLSGNLKRIGEGRTLIVITQRLASLMHADAILVLDRGEVQDIGVHRDLIGRSDIYSGMWRSQTARLQRPVPTDKRLPRGPHVA